MANEETRGNLQDKAAKHRTPLGSIETPKESLDQDWKLADGYIAYSAELLRLSLLALTGIATLCFKLQTKPGCKLAPIIWSFIVPITAFMISAASALVHRFLAIDSMAFHLKSLRLSIRKSPAYTDSKGKEKASDLERLEDEAHGRNLRFWIARRLLWMSAGALLVGLVCSALSLANW
jgi:hypothetical protein